MVLVSDWRGPLGSFYYCTHYLGLHVHVCVVLQGSSDVYGKTTECMMTLLVYKNICETLLIVSGDVESNPGPPRTCP